MASNVFNTVFVIFRQKRAKKCHFQCSKFFKNSKFLLLFHMNYGKKRPRFVVYLLCGSGCFVLAVGSPSDGSSAKRSATFLKK